MNWQIIPGVPGLAIIIILLFVAFIIIKFRKRKKDEIEKPELIDPEVRIANAFKDHIEKEGSKIKWKSLLTRAGIVEKGRVVAWSYFTYENEIDLTKAVKKNKTLEKVKQSVSGKPIKDNFYLLCVIKNNILYRILYALFSYGADYHLIDMKCLSPLVVDQVTLLTKNFDVYLDVESHAWCDHIYIYSKAGQNIVQAIYYHLTTKQVLKETVNHIPQMHYFDYKTAKFSAKAREIQAMKGKTWKQQQENLEKEADAED